jgi:hypothetical protein
MQSQLSPLLHSLIGVADSVARTHGIPFEVVMLHSLALGSALAGDLIRSEPNGPRLMQSKFSFLFQTPDDRLPLWIDEEWARLARRQEETRNVRPILGKSPHTVASLRRQRRIVQSLGLDSGNELDLIDSAIKMTKDKMMFRHIHRVDGRELPFQPKKEVRTLTLAAAGASELRRILKSRQKPKGLWAMLEGSEGPRSNLIAWMRDLDVKDIHRETGKEHYAVLGYRIDCPMSHFCPETDVRSGLMANNILRRLEVVRSGKIKFTFDPPAEAAVLLGRQVEETRALLATLPEADRGAALPDVFLAWHLTAILAALSCPETREEPPEIAFNQSAGIGCRLASWVVGQHLHHFRHAHPSDDRGSFTGQDLRVFRFLGPLPATPRQFQRRLRGVDKASCLLSLTRALEAGLAIEPEPGRFAVKPPPRRIGLSESLSESGLRPSSPPETPPNFTEDTEKSK